MKGGSFAATKAVMRAGRHFAQVTLGAGLLLFFGIVRPDWEGSQMPAGMRGKPVALLRSFYSLALLALSDSRWFDSDAGRVKRRNAHQVDGHCFISTRGGHCWPS
jgi:hypothetical protein